MLAGSLTIMAVIVAGVPTFTGKVVGVSDGDSITVRRGRGSLLVRLEGIDCPEIGQPFGRRAKRYSSGLVYRRVVKVIGKEWDSHGRLVARVRLGEVDVSLELVRAGLAWHYRRYSSDRALARAEKEARFAGRGLWRQANPTPPWLWRHSRPRNKRRRTDHIRSEKAHGGAISFR